MKRLNLTQSIFVDNVKINKSLINIIKKMELKKSEDGLESSYIKDNNHYLFHKIIPLLNSSFERICKELNFSSVTFTDLWVQKYNVAVNHDVHIHKVVNDISANKLYSFILYLDCGLKSGGTTFFNLGYPYCYLNQINVKPEVGKLLVFLSCLPHTANPSKDNKKLIVSGNIEFK